MCRVKSGVGILLVLIFLAGVVAPVPECFVTGVLCPRAKAYACSTIAPARSSTVAACCAKPEIAKVSLSRHRLSELRAWMKPYEPERERVQAPAGLVMLSADPFHRPVRLVASVLALTTEGLVKVPEPIPILLGKESFLI